MRNRAELNAYLCVILETVAETGDRGAPSGPMYAALMGRMDLETYNLIVGIAMKGELVTKDGMHVLTITPKGKETVAKIAAHRAAHASSSGAST